MLVGRCMSPRHNLHVQSTRTYSPKAIRKLNLQQLEQSVYVPSLGGGGGSVITVDGGGVFIVKDELIGEILG